MTEQPALPAYLGREFDTLRSDGRIWLRADELGHEFGLEPPEASVLDLYREHWPQFPDRLTAFLPVETPEGPRPMQVFDLLGAYVLATFVPQTVEVQRFRRFLMETIVHFQIDVRREIRDLAAEIQAVREAQASSAGNRGIDGDLLRLFERQTAALEEALSERVGMALAANARAALDEARLAAIERALGQMVELLVGLYDRLEALEPAQPCPVARHPDGEGVPVLELSGSHQMVFHHPESLGMMRVLAWGGEGPLFLIADLGTLFGAPEPIQSTIAEAGESWMPAERKRPIRFDNRDADDTLVDETGILAALAYWRGYDEGGKVREWIVNTVIPTVHALLFKEVEVGRFLEGDPGSEREAFARQPTEVVADGLFPVYRGEIDGRPCHLASARDLYKFLGPTWRSFADWFEHRCKRHGFKRDEHYLRVFVHIRQYDFYLELESARNLLWLEDNPKAVEARDFLLAVAMGEGNTIEGEAVRVPEHELVTIPFHERSLVSFRYEGEVHVAMKPLVEDMGLQWEAQLKRIKRNPVLYEGMSMMDIPTAGGLQTVAALPLKFLNGWLFGIDTKRVKEEIREQIVAYQRESYDVLYRYWHGLDQAQTVRRRQPVVDSPLSDTPLHAPLVFTYRDEKDHEIPVRVAIREGTAWFFLFDLGAASGEGQDQTRQAFAGIPECYRDLRPAPGAGSAVPLVSEAGLAYYLGGRPHKPAAERLRDWLVREVAPALREKLRAPPTLPVREEALPEAAIAFIDQAVAVIDLRRQFETESGRQLSTTACAEKLREAGHPVSRRNLDRMDYAVTVLLPLIPVALRHGLGARLVDEILRLEKAAGRYWDGLDPALRRTPFRPVFRQVLRRCDAETFDLEAFETRLAERIAKTAGIPAARVRAEAGLTGTNGRPRP